jgi:hypothetical protein
VKSLLKGAVIQNSSIEADDIGTGRQINAIEVGLTSFPKAKLHELPIRLESDCRALFWRRLPTLETPGYLRGRHLPTLSLHPSAPVIKIEHASSPCEDAPRFYQRKGLPSLIGS